MVDLASKQSRKLCIGTITRNRPVMLESLLASYSKLNLPENMAISFLIVENNEEETLSHVIADFKEKVAPLDVIYLVEPVLGIAKARNRVLNYAIDNGYDLLTFADDDEQVEREWLCELLKERDKHDLDIVGAPVRFAKPKSKLTSWQHIVWKGVDGINKNIEARCIKKRNEEKASELKLATGSWMGRLEFFRETQLRFNDELGQSGGEDWQLWRESKKLNAKTGWTPHAIAYETIPPSRLKLAYYYRRNRDHSRQVQMERMQNAGGNFLTNTLGSILSRFYKIIVGIISLPIHRENGLITVVANLGSLVGFIDGACGKKSMHYVDIDGH